MTRSRILPLAAALVAMAFCYAGFASAQTIHAGLGYSDHIGDPGVLVGASTAAGPVNVRGDFTYLFVSEDNTDAFMVDVNAAYPVLNVPAGPSVSVVGGLNLFRWSYSFEGFDESGTDISPAAGARVDHSFGPIGVFGQGQYVITGDSDGFTVGGGLSYKP